MDGFIASLVLAIVLTVGGLYISHKKRGRINCLVYAYWMQVFHGGAIMRRRSFIAKVLEIKSRWHPLWWVPHYKHQMPYDPEHPDQSLKITQYTLNAEQQQRFRDLSNRYTLFGIKFGRLLAWFNFWWFHGTVCDDDDTLEHL